MTTNVPPLVFTPTGVQLPQESAILAGVLADYNDALGGNMNTALETPQGQLASSTAAIVADSNNQMAELVNQVDPDTASGAYQDAIARIYFIDRSPGAPTVVTCQCIGNVGTVIPAGAQAQDTSGNRYFALESGVIPIGGMVEITFANIVDGPIPCPPDTLNRIYQSVVGWDTVNNSGAGTPGRLVESQSEFAYRRSQMVAINARGSLPSIYSNVFDVDGVIDVYVFENTTNITINVGATGYPLVPHSLYVAAVGGEAADIAQAIWEKKDVGCDYNGNTTEIVTDTSGYDIPYPTYTVKFERPAPVAIKFQVNITASTDLPSNIIDLVKASVIATFNGTDPLNTSGRVRIGSQLLASKFYPGIIRIGPEVSLLSVFIGTVTADQTSLLIGIDQNPTVTGADISVTLV